MVSKDVLKKFLKGLGYSYRRIRKVLKKTPEPDSHDSKLKEILQLVGLEKKNFLTIYYVDECGFNETPSVPYGWQSKDEPLTIPTTRGQRWNVFGIMSNDNQLFTHKTKGTITSDFVINAMDEFAQNPLRDPRCVLMMEKPFVNSIFLPDFTV